MIIQPKIRGFVCTTAHPQGCTQHVLEQIQYVQSQGPISNGPKKVLVIGASTGYGLASRIVAAFGCNAQTIGVFFEKAAEGKRTATAGWYNSAAFEQLAHQHALYAKSINGDAFSDEIKAQTIELIKKEWGGEVDCVIYSLASPRRTDPKTGQTYRSVLKPIKQSYADKTIDVMNGKISDISIDPANDDEINDTIAVMGGDDWQLWIDALQNAKVLAKGVKTMAYSYIGPKLTYPIYREGTIGKAKTHLEATAHKLTQQLSSLKGEAYVSVNKALVTQSSAAIPVVPLYISLLYKIMKAQGTHEGCIEQAYRLFHDKVYNAAGKAELDQQQLIRCDDWEMADKVQDAINQYWQQLTTENVTELTDLAGYQHDFHRLFGFEIEGVDYDAEVDPDMPIPSLEIAAETTS